MFRQVLNMLLVRLSLQSSCIGMFWNLGFLTFLMLSDADFIAICIFVFQFKTLFSFVSVTDIYRRHISSINTAYIIIRRQFFSVFNPLIHNVAKWSDKLEKSCSFFCCKIFKVYLTILVHYALKG